MLLPLLILLLGFASPMVFSVFLTLVLFVSLLEYNKMGLAGEHGLEQWLSAAAGAAVVPVLALNQPELLVPLYTGLYLVLALLFLFRLPPIEETHHRLGWLVSGTVYLPLLIGHLVPLHQLAYGKQWIFLLLIAVMACDSMAYFIGRKFGKRKLYPAVSPNKSIEGAYGGILGAVLGVLFAKLFFLQAIGWFGVLGIGVALGVFGQLGDLFESLLKRACRVKDSGTMIPGHGGLLDRLDSLLFVFPLVYYIAKYGYGG